MCAYVRMRESELTHLPTDKFSKIWMTFMNPGYAEFIPLLMKLLWVYVGSDLLWAGWSGDRIPVGGEIFHTLPDQS